MQDSPSCFKLFFKYKKYEIPCKFKNLTEVEDEIYSKLLFGPSHEYNVNSNVSEEIFSSFLDFWVYQKDPTITFENYHQYEQLNNEFKVMTEILNKVKTNFDEYEQNLYNLKYGDFSDKKEIEEKISENLDFYIERYGEELMSLNIQTLYNIFNGSNKKFNKHNEAYELIKNHFRKNNDDNIFILTSILDGQKLTYSNFKEIVCESKNRFGFIPNNEVSFFDSFNKEIQSINQKNDDQAKIIQKLENLINEQSIQINELVQKQKEEMNRQNEEFKKKIEETEKKQKDEIDKLNKDIVEIREKNQKQQDLIDQSFIENKNKIGEQEEKIKQLDKKMVEEDEKIDGINKKQDESELKINKQIEKIQQEGELNKEINEIKNYISYKTSKYDVPFIPNNEFNGVISFLKSISRNIFDEISITSSPVNGNNEEYSPKNSIKYDNPNVEVCCSGGGKIPWICFEFKNHRVIPKNYTMRSYNSVKDSHHPRTWNIEGSNDGNEWEILDEEKDCSFLNGPKLIHTFNISNPTNQEYRFLRFYITGKNWMNSLILNFNCIEFYGSILNNE